MDGIITSLPFFLDLKQLQVEEDVILTHLSGFALLRSGALVGGPTIGFR